MYENRAKQKLMQDQPAFGYSVGLGSPLAAELLSRSGIDFLLLDRQHGSWGDDGTIAALTAMHGGSAVPMARVARNDYTLIGRLLDDGVMGIVVPMVHTREESEAVALACRLPTLGGRSWGWGRARLYGDDYPDWINEQLFVAVQLESIQAVRNAEAILSVDGIDGCWTGPADLALSMGIHPRDIEGNDEHALALEDVLTACRNTGTVPGIATPSPEHALQKARDGFRFVTAGGDSGFILQGAAAGLETLSQYDGG